jgi:hypothetical protein
MLPLYDQIHDQTNHAEYFSREIETAVAIGFLKGRDILVLDKNASIHVQGDNMYLKEWLWESFGIFVIFLLTGTPEWNPPTELAWWRLVQCLD